MKNPNSILKSINSYKGILILGGPGSGKTVGPVQNIINEAITENLSGIIHTSLNIVFPSNYKAKIISSNPSVATIKINPFEKSILNNSIIVEKAVITLIDQLIDKRDKIDPLFKENGIKYLKAIILHLYSEGNENLDIKQLINYTKQINVEVFKGIIQNNPPLQFHEEISMEIIFFVNSLLKKIDIIEAEEYINDNAQSTGNFNFINDLLIIKKNPMSFTFRVMISLIIDIAIFKRTYQSSRPGIILLDDANYLKLNDLSHLPAVARSCKTTVVISDMAPKDITLIANLGYQINSNSYINSLEIKGIKTYKDWHKSKVGEFILYDILEDTTEQLVFDKEGNII